MRGPTDGSVVAETVFQSPYHAGDWEIQAMAGAYRDLEGYSDQPTFNYVLESLRIGYMMINPTGQACGAATSNSFWMP
jgi:hypothetical protein